MKKTIVILLAALIVTAMGCQKKEETGKAAAPPVGAQAAAPQPAPPQSVDPQVAAPQAAPQLPASHPPIGAPSGDPHAGLKVKEIPAGTGHKGKVLQVMEAGTYTYVEVEEKGQKLWIAALKTKLNKGDIVEFPDSKPMEKFESKALKRTFDKIIFAESIRVVK